MTRVVRFSSLGCWGESCLSQGGATHQTRRTLAGSSNNVVGAVPGRDLLFVVTRFFLR